MVIACCDSRADPATIFDADPGEMFVVRNVANLVPPFETGGGRHGVSAALEFAVTQLECREIVIMGHERCGGIEAALTGQIPRCRRWRRRHSSPTGWSRSTSQRDGHRRRAWHGPEAARLLEEVAIRQVSLANLRTFPFVAEREQAGSLGSPRLPFLDRARAACTCSTRRKMVPPRLSNRLR